MAKSGSFMQHIGGHRIWYPNFVASSVLAITPDILKEFKIKHLVFDVDETIAPKKGNILSKPYEIHLNNLRRAGIKLYIGSNATRDFSTIAKQVGARVILPSKRSFKPLKSYYQKVLLEAGSEGSHVAMVGDRLMNDMFGANRAGLTTILVDAMHRKPSWLRRYYLRRVLNYR